MILMTKNEYLEMLFDAYTKEEFYSTFGISYNNAENGEWNMNLQYAYDEFLAEEQTAKENHIKDLATENCFIELILDTMYVGTEEKSIITLPKDITEDDLYDIFIEYVEEHSQSYCYLYDNVPEEHLTDENLANEYEEYLQRCIEYSSYRELFVEDTDDLEYLVKNFIE